MQPQQPYQQPPQYPPQPAPGSQGGGNQSNFDFIMNPAKPPKKPGFSLGGLNIGKLVLVLGGVFVIVIILAIILSATKNSGFNKPAMLAVAQDQAEIIRLVKLGEKNTKSQVLANFNATAALSTETDQTAFITYVNKNGFKPNTKDIALGLDSTVDTQLDGALSSGTYDTVYKDALDKKLAKYQSDLSAAYKNAGPKGQELLKAQFNNAKLLRLQLNAGN